MKVIEIYSIVLNKEEALILSKLLGLMNDKDYSDRDIEGKDREFLRDLFYQLLMEDD